MCSSNSLLPVSQKIPRKVSGDGCEFHWLLGGIVFLLLGLNALLAPALIATLLPSGVIVGVPIPLLLLAS